jgi:ribosomal protein S18 acetylase RimI-like enzyme
VCLFRGFPILRALDCAVPLRILKRERPRGGLVCSLRPSLRVELCDCLVSAKWAVAWGFMTECPLTRRVCFKKGVQATINGATAIRPVMQSIKTMCMFRRMETSDIEGVIALQKRAFPKMPPWTRTQLRHHLKNFPEGQLVAVDRSGRIVGSASSLIIRWDAFDRLASWDVITGRGRFGTHDPHTGNTLYGADVGVDPDARGMGVGALLYEGRRAIAKRHHLSGIIAGGRIPGYAACAKTMSAQSYVSEVVEGLRHDPVLSFQLREGFVVKQVIPGYLPYDKPSCGYATLIEWRNPEWDDLSQAA